MYVKLYKFQRTQRRKKWSAQEELHTIHTPNALKQTEAATRTALESFAAKRIHIHTHTRSRPLMAHACLHVMHAARREQATAAQATANDSTRLRRPEGAH